MPPTLAKQAEPIFAGVVYIILFYEAVPSAVPISSIPSKDQAGARTGRAAVDPEMRVGEAVNATPFSLVVMSWTWIYNLRSISARGARRCVVAIFVSTGGGLSA